MNLYSEHSAFFSINNKNYLQLTEPSGTFIFIRARVNPFGGFHRGGNGMHEISPDELFNMFFQVRPCILFFVSVLSSQLTFLAASLLSISFSNFHSLSLSLSLSLSSSLSLTHTYSLPL